MERRRIASVAALFSAALLLAQATLGWSTAVALGHPFGRVPLVTLAPLASVLVVVVGASLLWRGHVRSGAAVLVASTVLSLPLLASTLLLLRGPRASPLVGSVLLFVSAFALLAVAAALAASEMKAWPSRRPSHPGALFVIGMALSGVVWPVVSTQVPLETYDPTAWSQPLVFTTADVWSRWVFVLAAVATATVLLYAASATRRVGAVVVVTAVVPWLLGDLGAAIDAARRPDAFFTPAGWVSIAGQVLLLALAATWWVRGRDDRAPAAAQSVGSPS
ncbi:hypothetical protein [Egicoccus sp. AB-alg2]|uniref:hypothetical protein n=1 Tax=Egicoccus sp. AB-alg2 TaxID=3242693 RepID=UPI00359E05D9